MLKRIFINITTGILILIASAGLMEAQSERSWEVDAVSYFWLQGFTAI